MNRKLLVLLTVGAIAIAAFALLPQQKTANAQDEEKLILPAQDPDSIARRDFMRTKLMFTQNVLRGLTLGDFDAIEEATLEVQRITESEAWIQIDNDQYRKLTDEFKTAANRLMIAAKTRNLDATAMRFYNMSTSCIDCHQHLRKAEYQF